MFALEEVRAEMLFICLKSANNSYSPEKVKEIVG